MEKPEEGLLARWSRHKRAAERASPNEPAGRQDLHDSDVTGREEAERKNREVAEAVDLATLDRNSDLSLFMKRGVPALLRRSALATVWRSDPVFANLDGLVDHGEDYRNPNLIMKSYKSAWKVGRGYLKVIPAPIAKDTSGPAPDASPSAANPSLQCDDGSVPAEAVQNPENRPPVQAPAPADPVQAVHRVSLRRRLSLDEGEG